MRAHDLAEAVCGQLGALGYNVSEVNRSTVLTNLPDWDSLDRVELAMRLEKELNVTISDHELENWLLVEDVVNTLKSKSDGRG